MSDDQEPTIYIVDDDKRLANALKLLVSEAGFKAESYSFVDDFLKSYERSVPGCVILDVSLGDRNGLDVVRDLSAGDNQHPVIFISGRSDIHTGVEAMKMGAVDFLSKPVSPSSIFGAIHSALEKDRLATQKSQQKKKLKQLVRQLTPREYQVLNLVIHGRLNKQIAYQLGITEKTAKVHRARVMTKMGARNVAELVHSCGALESVQNTDLK